MSGEDVRVALGDEFDARPAAGTKEEIGPVPGP